MIIIFPIENMPNITSQLVVAIESIIDNFKNTKYEIIVVNHNHSKLPKTILKYIESKKEVRIIHKKLTNNKFYYKTESHFMVMPEVFNYVVDHFRDESYLFLDPDVYVNKDLPPINENETYVFKQPLNFGGEALNYWNCKILNEIYPHHYDTFFIYTSDKDFAKKWLGESTRIAKMGINHKDRVVGNRLQHFCEECSIQTLINKGYSIKDAKEFFLANAYLNKEIQWKGYSVYHYDYSKILNMMDINPKYKTLYRVVGGRLDEESEKNLTFDDKLLELVKREIDNYLEKNIKPSLKETLFIMRFGKDYDFSD